MTLKMKIDEWRPLLNALQLKIDKRKEVQISYEGSFKHIVDSEESFANEFSKLICFIRNRFLEDEGCGMSGELIASRCIQQIGKIAGFRLVNGCSRRHKTRESYEANMGRQRP